MILRILFIFLFVLVCGCLFYFIYGIFIPAVKSQIQENNDPLFADVELNYVGKTEKSDINVSDKVAYIDISGNKNASPDRLIYNGVRSCKLFNSIYDTKNDISNVCIGFGDCVKACPQEAIAIENNVAVVTKNCCGCGKCLTVCPKNIIKLVPVQEEGKNLSEKKYFKFWKSCYRILKK